MSEGVFGSVIVCWSDFCNPKSSCIATRGFRFFEMGADCLLSRLIRGPDAGGDPPKSLGAIVRFLLAARLILVVRIGRDIKFLA